MSGVGGRTSVGDDGLESGRVARDGDGKMRIVYFYQYFTTPKGAWSTRVYEFARRWVRAGHRVTVVTSVYDKSDLEPRGLLDRIEVEGIDVRVINVRLSNKHGFLVRIASFLAYAVLGSWYALTLPADVVVASSGPITVGIPGLVARWLRRRPFVFEVRDLWPEGAIQLGVLRSKVAIRMARWFEGVCYRSATTVVAASPGQAEWIEERRGLGSKLAVVPNASDCELADDVGAMEEPPEWARGRRLATYAGTLGLIDDCAQLVRIAAELERRGRDDLLVLVIGDGKERPLVEGLVAELGVSNIRLLGLRPKDEVFRWLAVSLCSLFVVKDTPFLKTASPNKVFDAFAVGIPVLQGTDGWIGDLVEREGCGLNVHPPSAVGFADAIERLADEPELRGRLRDGSRRLGRTTYSRDAVAAEMLGLLEAAAGRRSVG